MTQKVMFLAVFFSLLLSNTIPTVENIDFNKKIEIDKSSIVVTNELSIEDINIIIDKYKDIKISQKNLLNLLIELRVQHPEIVLRQAVLESNNFSSSLFKRGNNLFGMRKPAQRKTFALNKKFLGYATFESWQHSAADYKLWQGTKLINNYHVFLIKRKYAADKNYINKLKNINLNVEDTI